MKARNALLWAVPLPLCRSGRPVDEECHGISKICDYVYFFALVAALFYVVALKPRREKKE